MCVVVFVHFRVRNDGNIQICYVAGPVQPLRSTYSWQFLCVNIYQQQIHAQVVCVVKPVFME